LNRLLYLRLATVFAATVRLPYLTVSYLFPFYVFVIHQRWNGILIVLHMVLHPFPLNTNTHVHISA
jgi:hypothetical protein